MRAIVDTTPRAAAGGCAVASRGVEHVAPLAPRVAGRGGRWCGGTSDFDVASEARAALGLRHVDGERERELRGASSGHPPIVASGARARESAR
jgi:hypothetical protein